MAKGITGLKVLSLGGRGAVDICADLLARAGAIVECGEPTTARPEHDIILFSSDRFEKEVSDRLAAVAPDAILCDIATIHADAAGREFLDDSSLQARSGLMDVTGFPSSGPTATALPMIDLSGGFYAASLVMSMKLSKQVGVSISVSLLACAVSALTTFLPSAFVGARAGRIGNRHPACAPWNAYAVRDGYVLICTSSDEQWVRLRAIINSTEVFESRFDRLDDRLATVDEIDRLVSAWTTTLTTAECLARCEGAGIPAGAIVAPHQLWQEENFRFRHPEAAVAQEKGKAASEVAGRLNLLRTERLAPGVGESRIEGIGGALPLSGLRVVEIGQYTAVPLAVRHLAALGAEVTKIEPPLGEVARRWKPTRDGMSYFFAITNADKEIEFLNLSQRDGRARLEKLVAESHVLIENMRPGALAKLGFDRARLARLNPALVYCGVSGFGSQSVYPGRPAFDTVVQGVAGLMELTLSDGRPVKLGVSAADILGAQLVIYALIASLPRGGLFIDIAMQDVAAWASIVADCWPAGAGNVTACLDGALWVEEGQSKAFEAEARALPRVLAQQQLNAAGIRAQLIVRVEEVFLDPAVRADVLAVAREADGKLWPSLRVPYRINGRPFPTARVPRRMTPPLNR